MPESPPNSKSELFTQILYILIVIALIAILIFVFIKIRKLERKLESNPKMTNQIKQLPDILVNKSYMLQKQQDVDNIIGDRDDISSQFDKIYTSNLDNNYILENRMKKNIDTDGITVNGNPFGKDYIDYNITNTCNLEVTDVIAFNTFKIDNNSIRYTDCNLFFESVVDTVGDLYNSNYNFNAYGLHAQSLNFNDDYNISSKIVSIPSSKSISILNETNNIHSFDGMGTANHSGDVNIKNCIYFNDATNPDSFEKNKICEKGIMDNKDKIVTFQNDLVDVNGNTKTSNVNILNNIIYSDNSSNMYIMNNMGEKFIISLNKWG